MVTKKHFSKQESIQTVHVATEINLVGLDGHFFFLERYFLTESMNISMTEASYS
jgi:hypothetical protein